MNAAEELLQVTSIANLSTYDIARQASISPPSVSYLFPTMGALRIELSRRYNEQMTQAVAEAQMSLARMRNPTWQDWIRLILRSSCDFLNAHRHVCEVLLGPVLHLESKRENLTANDRVGATMAENFRTLFVVSEMPGLADKFVLVAEIADGIFSRSYVLKGRIDDDSVEDTARICIAYLRLFLPEVLPLARESRK